MRLISVVKSFFRSCFRKRQIDAELVDEIHSTLGLLTDQKIKDGMTPQEARRAARIELGGVEQVKEEVRAARVGAWIDTLLQDVRFGLRMLRKSPAFAAVAVLTLAVGIGANTAIFSVMNSVLLEPLPFKNPSQLVDLRESENAPGDFPLNGGDYLDWQAQSTTFSSMSLYTQPRGQNASGAGAPESASVRGMQANFFDTLGVRPLIGRTFVKGEDQGTHYVAILSYGFWQRHFGGQADALGKTLLLDNEPYTVVGVMPQWLAFPASTDVFVPLDMTSELMHDRGNHWALAIGRLKPGVSIGQARADLMTISDRIIKQYGRGHEGIHSLLFPLKQRLVGESRTELLVLLGAVALVLLVACANITNLLLARSTVRQREMAVRAATGASRWRLLRQLLTESFLLAAGGATIGVLAAWWCVGVLQSDQTLPIPRIRPVHVNVTVLLFAVGVSLLVGILSGIAPAVHISHVNLSEELKSSAATVANRSAGKFLRGALIAAEIAVSLSLLVGAGLLLRTFATLRNTNIGVQTKDVLTARLNLPVARYNTLEKREEFFKELLVRLGQVPGVKSAAVSYEIALEGGSNGYVTVPGNTNPALANQLVEDNAVTPSYFTTFGIPFVRGRNFTDEDLRQAGEVNHKVDALFERTKDWSSMKVPPAYSFPVIINQSMATTFWPKQNPIGKEYLYGGPAGVHATVIGVVGNERQWGIQKQPIPEAYRPLTMVLDVLPGQPGASTIISLKTAVEPASLAGAMRDAVEASDNTLAPFHVRTMIQVVAENMQDTSISTLLLGVFAAIGMLLAAIGIYGVVSFLVGQRTHEIGIRMALGAQPEDILEDVLGTGGKMALAGIALGLVASFGLTRLMKSLLFGVSATDPLTFAAVTGLLLGVALLACWIPARRAMRVDPMVALRYE